MQLLMPEKCTILGESKIYRIYRHLELRGVIDAQLFNFDYGLTK